MAKSSTRRVTIYINGKEVEAFVIFEFFVFSPPPKPPPMNRHRPYRLMDPLTGICASRGNALGYRYASPDGDGGRGNQHFGARHVSAATPPQCDGATTTLHSPLYSLLSSYTFSAKEKDSETGFSYFGSRYYSSDLSIWLSVDPMSDKYPSLSPYVYCANNPVRLVDPNGEDVVPSNKFIASTYYAVFQKMQNNSVYKKLSSRFSDNNNTINFHLDYNANPFTSDAGRNGIDNSTLVWHDGIVVSGNVFSEYGRPNGIELSEIAKVQVLLHEIIHANNKLDNIKTPDHNDFDREKVLLGLIEYNETNNLGYSNDDLEILSWCGLTQSKDFTEYINSQAEKNGNSKEKEIQAFNIRLNLLLMNTAPEARQED